MEIESIWKTQTVWILEMNKLGIWTGMTELIFTNGIQEMEERILVIEVMIEEMNTSKKILNPKNY